MGKRRKHVLMELDSSDSDSGSNIETVRICGRSICLLR